MLWHFENEIDGSFSRLEETLMETLVNVLRPFEQATRELTAETAELSQVIPPVRVLWLLMHDSSSPHHPGVIQQGILFVAKTVGGEKKDGANYFKIFFGLRKKASVL